MALEDFEKRLAEERAEHERNHAQKRRRSRSQDRRKEHRHRHHHHSSRREREHSDGRKHGNSRNQDHHNDRERRHDRKRRRSHSPQREEESRSNGLVNNIPQLGVAQAPGDDEASKPQRMSWMEAPSSNEIEHVQSRRPKTPPGYFRKGIESDRPQEQQEQSNNDTGKVADILAQHDVDYTFGDAGSQWRLKKLQGVYRDAKESNKPIDEVAIERFGDLRSFDDAREEEIEMDRRQMYGEDYVGKEKPSGELFEERRLAAGIRREGKKEEDLPSEDEFEAVLSSKVYEKSSLAQTVPLDQAALDKLKSNLDEAKHSGSSDASQLEARYEAALASAANLKQPDVVVLNRMENRMLAGGREGEVKTITNKRGRERGLVEENEDMSIEDMVRQERRTRHQQGGDGRAFAERIAKDGKFDNDLDYMDDNAAKLAKTVQKSDFNLRNSAISDFKKMKRILDTCPLCTNEDTGQPPKAPVVSLATRTYLTLPTSPEITPYGFCASIVPVQHRLNLLECDDDEWEEIRNFMKSLTRFYYSMKPKRTVIFYENAAHEGRKRHASMEAVPLPVSVAETISQYFREAILSADEEWTQHKKVIDTLKKSEEAGFGKNAFRKSMVSELPYFHVWFRLDGGLGHVVEDPRRWPKGDLFAREILGGVLDVPPEKIKRQGRWRRDDEDMQERVRNFRKTWEQWDWTKVLMDPS